MYQYTLSENRDNKLKISDYHFIGNLISKLCIFLPLRRDFFGNCWNYKFKNYGSLILSTLYLGRVEGPVLEELVGEGFLVRFESVPISELIFLEFLTLRFTIHPAGYSSFLNIISSIFSYLILHFLFFIFSWLVMVDLSISRQGLVISSLGLAISKSVLHPPFLVY